MVDLTVSGTSATINGALFISDAFSDVAGTGIFPSFVKIQSRPTEQGYNYDNEGGIDPQFDEGNEAPHNHAVLLSDVTILERNGTLYFVFGLDSNEPNNATKLLSLDALQIWTANTGSLTNFKQPVEQGGTGVGFADQGGTLVYDMDGAGDAVVLTNSQAAGSGRPDLGVFIPVENFGDSDPSTTYVYLYSAFGYEGGEYETNSGFEEWSTPQVAGVEAGINIEKVTGDGPGGVIVDGDGVVLDLDAPVTWTYTVTNTGNVPLSNVVVTDDQGETPVYQSGDAGVIGVLDVGETWVYTATGTADQAAYSNTGSVTGEYLQLEVSDSDPSSYSTKGPGNEVILIDIEKVTLDGKIAAAADAEDGFLLGTDGASIFAGEDITWIYKVTNTGTVDLTDVTVDDDQLDPDPVYATGDDGDNVLEVGESWYFTATGVAGTVDYENTGKATGKFEDTEVSDSDDSSYKALNPSLVLEKETQDLGDLLDLGDDGTPGDDNVILVGEAIQWIYTLTNDGNVDLYNIVVVDDAGTPDDELDDIAVGTIAFLAAGDGAVLYVQGVAEEGDYANTATATAAKVVDSVGHEVTPVAEDKSAYFGADPQIEIEKRTLDGTTTPANVAADFLNAEDGATIITGNAITWIYKVTNVGNVALSNVALGDDNLGTLYLSGDSNKNGLLDGVETWVADGDANNDGKLDTTETWYYTATGTAGAGLYENVGTASGSFTDTADHTRTDTEDDDSSYLGFDPGQPGRTQGFWGKHTEAWDGTHSNDGKWAKLVGKGLYSAEINPAPNGDVLLGDLNFNGTSDAGEVTISISNAIAKSILSSSVQGDHRISFLQQAIAAQLNIYNKDINPGDDWPVPEQGEPGKATGDMITEAVIWLQTFGGSGSGTTTVSFADGTLDAGEYKSGKFVSSQTAAQDAAFWSTPILVDGTSAATKADGENLKDVLEAFNQNKLVVSEDGLLVGWNLGGENSFNVIDAQFNTPDAFWSVAASHMSGFG